MATNKIFNSMRVISFIRYASSIRLSTTQKIFNLKQRTVATSSDDLLPAYINANIPVITDMLHNHKLYTSIKTKDHLQIFMKNHIFAVWDFMCLLKTLQRNLTGQGPIWIPPENTELAHLIHSICLGEETDEVQPNQYVSHLELYRRACHEIGASTEQFDNFLDNLCNVIEQRINCCNF